MDRESNWDLLNQNQIELKNPYQYPALVYTLPKITMSIIPLIELHLGNSQNRLANWTTQHRLSRPLILSHANCVSQPFLSWRLCAPASLNANATFLPFAFIVLTPCMSTALVFWIKVFQFIFSWSTHRPRFALCLSSQSTSMTDMLY